MTKLLRTFKNLVMSQTLHNNEKNKQKKCAKLPRCSYHVVAKRPRDLQNGAKMPHCPAR